MSGPLKKPGPAPESYSPKAVPEIMRLAEDARQLAAGIPYVLTAPHTLETERLIIRRFRPEDWRDLQEIGISNNASEFADFDHPWAADARGAKKACKWCVGNEHCWAVEVKGLAKVVCFVNFNGIAEAIEKDYGRAMDVGHAMNGAYFGNGFDYEALAVLYDHCFRHECPDAIVAGWMMGDKEKLEPLVKLGMALHSTGMGKAFRGDRTAEGCLAVIAKEIWEQNNPTSYSPKAAPEIMRLAQQDRTKRTRRSEKVSAEPEIVSKRFALVGAESKIDAGSDFDSALGALYRRVTDQLSRMRGLAQPVRMAGYWYYPTPGSFDDIHYFAGVEADAACVPAGLAAKLLPESLYAVFAEERRGMAGGPEGAGYRWLNRSKEYDYNEVIPGDLEVYANLTDTGPDCEAEIYIPIKARK